MEEHTDKSHSTEGTGKTNGNHGTSEVPTELYRSQTFPSEILDQGWKANPEAWNPPPHLRARVMASFDQKQQNRFSPKWIHLLTEGVRIPLPLAVTTACMVLGLGFWVVFRPPQTIMVTTPYSKPGPAVVFPVPEKVAPLDFPVSIPSTDTPRSRVLEKSPVFRGGGRESDQTVAPFERVWLSPGTLRLEVDGVEVTTSTTDTSGTAFWIQTGQTGGFILTLFPTTDSGPKPQGTLDKGEIQFEFEGVTYHLACERQLVTRRVAVWVHHTRALPSQTEMSVGCAPTPDQAFQILQKGKNE